MMYPSTDDDLRDLLSAYTVPGPSPELLRRTTMTMREALMPAPVPAPAVHVTAMVALALALSLGLCYVLTVGTVLSFLLPAEVMRIVRHSLIAFGGVGGCMLAGTLMVLTFRQWCDRHALSAAGIVRAG